MAQPPAVAGMGFSAQAPDGVVRCHLSLYNVPLVWRLRN
jgi:hypothetical protein